jgi:hypothetical protein
MVRYGMAVNLFYPSLTNDVTKYLLKTGSLDSNGMKLVQMFLECSVV